jgi:solute carrier family 13 (sodium-dependent dicarboxylate transporter), member 2/3/5
LSASLPATESPALAARIGLIAGPVLALVVYLLLPSNDLTLAARAAGGVATLMAVWWMTEALPLEATALLPLVLLPLTGTYEGSTAFKRAAAPYADPAIFLFLGGFIIALAIEKWGLHRRIALLTLLVVGTSPSRLVAGFLIATAVISMWISNTATTVMMLPIGLAVVQLVSDRLRGNEGTEAAPNLDAANLATSLLLAIAYAASLGGFATLVGTPPNIYFAGYMREQGVPIDFWRWMIFATPLSLLYVFITWLLLTRWLFPVRLATIPGGRELIAGEYRKLGGVSRGEWIVLVVFVCTAALWMFREALQNMPALVQGLLRRTELPETFEHALLRIAEQVSALTVVKSLDDPMIAMCGAIALFLIPVNASQHEFAMEWRTAVRLPWGVLVLFGGGLSLAEALKTSGLATWIGEQASGLAALPPFWQIVLLVALIVFTGELTSNLAAVVALLPILFEVATALDLDPRLFCVPAAVAASCGFMLPVATPPNAIVFGAGHIRLGQMIRAGLALDLVAVILIPIFTYLLGPIVLGIKM